MHDEDDPVSLGYRPRDEPERVVDPQTQGTDDVDASSTCREREGRGKALARAEGRPTNETPGVGAEHAGTPRPGRWIETDGGQRALRVIAQLHNEIAAPTDRDQGRGNRGAYVCRLRPAASQQGYHRCGDTRKPEHHEKEGQGPAPGEHLGQPQHDDERTCGGTPCRRPETRDATAPGSGAGAVGERAPRHAYPLRQLTARPVDAASATGTGT
jgi:hypothetical protein